MVRSFPTRLPNSRIGFVLLIPCLLICLACATPFPIDHLEKGMTTETVRERFGEPSAKEPGGSPWTYVDRELDIGAAVLGWPMAPLFVVVSWFPNDFKWNDLYVSASDVDLYFEAEKLIGWRRSQRGYKWDPPAPGQVGMSSAFEWAVWSQCVADANRPCR